MGKAGKPTFAFGHHPRQRARCIFETMALHVAHRRRVPDFERTLGGRFGKIGMRRIEPARNHDPGIEVFDRTVRSPFPTANPHAGVFAILTDDPVANRIEMLRIHRHALGCLLRGETA